MDVPEIQILRKWNLQFTSNEI